MDIYYWFLLSYCNIKTYQQKKEGYNIFHSSNYFVLFTANGIVYDKCDSLKAQIFQPCLFFKSSGELKDSQILSIFLYTLLAAVYFFYLI